MILRAGACHDAVIANVAAFEREVKRVSNEVALIIGVWRGRHTPITMFRAELNVLVMFGRWRSIALVKGQKETGDGMHAVWRLDDAGDGD